MKEENESYKKKDSTIRHHRKLSKKKSEKNEKISKKSKLKDTLSKSQIKNLNTAVQDILKEEKHIKKMITESHLFDKKKLKYI